MANLKNSEERRNQVKELTDQLEKGVRNFFESEKYAEYLRVMSKFTHYSVNNTILIAMQKPDASMVAGYKAWQTNFGRNVNRGEQGIRILSPMTYRTTRERDRIDPETNQPMLDEYGKIVREETEVIVPSFKVTYVFDVSQTTGKPLPSLINDLDGFVNEYQNFLSAVRKISPVPIGFETMQGKDGYYHQVEQRIAINDAVSERQAMAAIIHELSHAKIHALDPDNLNESAKVRGKDQRTIEVEAESISYVVNAHFGIDTSENSWGYVASWSKNKELPELRASLQIIKDTAADIIENIEMELAEIRNKYVDIHSEKMTASQIATELIKLAEEFDLYDFKDRIDDPEYLQEEIEYNLLAGKGMEYAPFLNDVIEEESPELMPRATILLKRIQDYEPENIKNMAPIVKVKYSEYLKLPSGKYGSLMDIDKVIADMDKEIVTQKAMLSEDSNAINTTYTVRVSILYTRDEKIASLEGRIELGAGYGGLLDNIKADVNEKLNSESWKQYLQGMGEELYQKEIMEFHNQQDNILPYLQQFCSLEERTPEVLTKNTVVTEKGSMQSDQRVVPQKTEKRSIHERLKDNREKLRKMQGKENLREGVELA